MYIRNRS